MMINKENKGNAQEGFVKEPKGCIDTAKMDVQCHILIRDKDTKAILVNKRG